MAAGTIKYPVIESDHSQVSGNSLRTDGASDADSPSSCLISGELCVVCPACVPAVDVGMVIIMVVVPGGIVVIHSVTPSIVARD